MIRSMRTLLPAIFGVFLGVVFWEGPVWVRLGGFLCFALCAVLGWTIGYSAGCADQRRLDSELYRSTVAAIRRRAKATRD